FRVQPFSAIKLFDRLRSKPPYAIRRTKSLTVLWIAGGACPGETGGNHATLLLRIASARR
ncbi:MAG: hypothetical protein ACLPKH_20380, partial [Rhodomicrobium sp.]